MDSARTMAPITHAYAANPAQRRPALFEADEAAIPACRVGGVIRTPRIVLRFGVCDDQSGSDCYSQHEKQNLHCRLSNWPWGPMFCLQPSEEGNAAV
jgi:hypothetical protein